MRFLNIYDPITNQYDTDVALNLISNNEANMFRCYLPFPSGEKEVLGEFFYPVGIDPKGDSILEILDKDSLEDIVEDLEHEHPDTTKEQFCYYLFLFKIKIKFFNPHTEKGSSN